MFHYFTNMAALYFCVKLVSQHVWFCSMCPDHAKDLLHKYPEFGIAHKSQTLISIFFNVICYNITFSCFHLPNVYSLSFVSVTMKMICWRTLVSLCHFRCNENDKIAWWSKVSLLYCKLCFWKSAYLSFIVVVISVVAMCTE